MGAQRLVGRFDMLPDRNRVYIDDLLLSIGNSAWIPENETYIDVFGRTVVIPGLVLQSRSAEADILQSVQLSGIYSSLPGDTTTFVIDRIALRPISRFLNMNMPMGGCSAVNWH